MSDKHIPIAAKSLEDLKNEIGATNSIKNHSLSDAVLVKGVQVWVCPYYDKYRNVWLDAGFAIPTDYEIDHIYPKARGMQQGYSYVRIAAIPRRANRSAGSWIEKQRTKLEKERQGIPPIRYSCNLEEIKLRGMRTGGKHMWEKWGTYGDPSDSPKKTIY